MGIVIFNGISSADYGIQVEHPPDYAFPQRDYEITHVPGRNGDIVLDKGSYQNVDRSYEIAIGNEKLAFVPMANTISEWLHSASGYAKLEDSYEPDYYRMAMYEEAGSIENILFHAGRATINFNCKPQRYLKSGDDKISIVSYPKIIYNPTRFNSLPIITLYAKGNVTLTIGEYIVNISLSTSYQYLTIDSEIQDCYYGTKNMNSYVTFKSGFPKLVPGENRVTRTLGANGGMVGSTIVPKWWTL